MKKALIIAPHPDDESLGAGGTLLRLKSEGYKTYWMIVTEQNKKELTENKIFIREKEIKKVSKYYNFDETIQLKFKANMLDTIPLDQIIKKFKKVFDKIKPELIFTPFEKDVHTDHLIVSRATLACVKSFRNPNVKKVLAYEVISETDFNFTNDEKFKAQIFYDISKFLNKKINISKIYKSEMSKHPFPRSTVAIKSLANLRGAQSGFKSAEAFQLIFEKI